MHILHIGYHKTATNWFQRVYYPNIENFSYIHRKRVRRAFLRDSAFRFSPERARSELGERGSTNLILCEEELSGNIHSGGLFGYLSKEVATRLKLTLPDSRITIFIRNQFDMIASAYKQYVREGGTHLVDRYLHPPHYAARQSFSSYRIPLFSFDHFEYYPLIKHYEALFGRENVHIFLYEDFRRDPADFMARFRDVFQFRVDHGRLSFEKINVSYKKWTLVMAKILNRLTHLNVVDKRYIIHIPMFYQYERKLLKWLNKYRLFGMTPSPWALLGKENMGFIRRRFSASNRSLETDYGLRLRQLGYPC